MRSRLYPAALACAALLCLHAAPARAAGAPTVTTGAASSVGVVHATLDATVDPADAGGVYVQFEYWTDPSFPTVAGPYPAPYAGPVAQTVSGLQPSTAYHYVAEVGRLDEQGGFVAGATGDTADFTTLDSSPPTATTEPATDVYADAATLHGGVATDDEPTGYRFEYWTGDQRPDAPAFVEGDVGDWAGHAGDIRRVVSGLEPGTTYHYRMVALRWSSVDENLHPAGMAGDVQTFTTADAPPVVTTGPAAAVDETSATVTGTILPNDWWLDYRFEWGPDASYGNDAGSCPEPWSFCSAGSGTDLLSLSARVTGLDASATYHFRLLTVDDATQQTRWDGGDATFTTAPTTVSVDDAAPVREGGPDTTTDARFHVSLSAPSAQPVSVGYASFAGSGTLRFAAHDTTAQTVDVPIRGDAIHEGDRTFHLTLAHPVNATLGRARGTGTILDDDPAPTVGVGGPGPGGPVPAIVAVGVGHRVGLRGLRRHGLRVAVTFAGTGPATVALASGGRVLGARTLRVERTVERFRVRISRRAAARLARHRHATLVLTVAFGTAPTSTIRIGVHR